MCTPIQFSWGSLLVDLSLGGMGQLLGSFFFFFLQGHLVKMVALNLYHHRNFLCLYGQNLLCDQAGIHSEIPLHYNPVFKSCPGDQSLNQIALLPCYVSGNRNRNMDILLSYQNKPHYRQPSVCVHTTQLQSYIHKCYVSTFNNEAKSSTNCNWWRLLISPN